MPVTLILSNDAVRKRACNLVNSAPDYTRAVFHNPGRTIPQNARFWAMLTDISRQAEHNGRKYTADDWKALFMHACDHETRFVQGLNGEPFPVGFSSKKLSKAQMSDLMEFMSAWAAERGIKFSEPNLWETVQ